MFFAKYGLQDNHWVGNSLINSAEAKEFKKGNTKREGKQECSENVEM